LTAAKRGAYNDREGGAADGCFIGGVLALMGGYGIFLIAALIAASGIIAYVGDVIGRRMGRRRLTLFGLRPRHTAVVVSVFAGMLIAAFTLTAAMMVSQNVRDAFLHVAAMRRETVRLKRATRALEAGILRSKQRAATAQRELKDAKRRLTAVMLALKLQTERLEHQRQALAAARSRLGTVSTELKRKIADLAQQRKNLQATARRLSQVTAELDAERRELAAQRQELETTRGTLAATQEKLASEAKRLAEVEAKLDDANRQLDNATRVVRETTRTLFGLESQRDQLQAQIQDLSQWRSRALETFGQIRSEPVIFGANEEILTVVIPGARPPEQVRADLKDFVKLVNQVALNAGAGEGADGRGIAIFRPVADETTGQVQLYGEDQVLGALATAIGSAQGSVIVRAASAGNVVRGETVVVDFELFHNDLVFRQGEELARTALDSSRDQASLLLDLVEFLRSKVASRARARGVMARPAATLGQGKEALFPGPESVVGEMAYPELLAVIRQIQGRRGMVQIVARAAGDTWTAGPLRVKLTVEGRA